jgi:hypothetical protein
MLVCILCEKYYQNADSALKQYYAYYILSKSFEATK